MKRLIVLGILVALSAISLPVQAETRSFASTCQFRSQDTNINERDCTVTKTYNDTSLWTHTQIKWSDGVTTEIEIQTVNRRPSDRVDSRYGLATVDDATAEYQTFSDGGICFTIERSQNTICYR